MFAYTNSIRCFGCAAEGLCHVANGSLDAFFDYGTHAWDVAAGALIVQEAGGILSEPNGNYHGQSPHTQH